MRNLAKCCLAGFLLTASAAAVMPAGDEPRAVVERFGAALLQRSADGLLEALPAEGKVRVHLDRLGPRNGALRGGQLHALLQDFLERGTVRSFELRTIERTDRLALAMAAVELTDEQGIAARVRLHLSLEPENERWVLREIRESSR